MCLFQRPRLYSYHTLMARMTKPFGFLIVLFTLFQLITRTTAAGHVSMRCFDTIFNIGEEAQLICTFGAKVHISHYKWWYQSDDSKNSKKSGVYTFDVTGSVGTGHEDVPSLTGRTSSSYTENNGTIQLLISKAELMDSGVYTCEAAFRSGEIQEQTLKHTVTIPGKRLVQTYNLVENQGRRLICAFNTIGGKVSRVTWSHKGLGEERIFSCHIMGDHIYRQPCSSGNNYEMAYYPRNKTTSLVIMKASASENGEYTCTAEGSTVSMFATLRLQPHGSPTLCSSRITHDAIFFTIIAVVLAVILVMVTVILWIIYNLRKGRYSGYTRVNNDIKDEANKKIHFCKEAARGKTNFDIGFKASEYKDKTVARREEHPEKYFRDTFGVHEIEAINKRTESLLDSNLTCVKIAVLSTGINKDHPLLKKIQIEQNDLINSSATCNDGYGEGTFLAGIIAEICRDISEQVKIFDIKMTSDEGKVKFSVIKEAFEYCQSQSVNIILAPYCVKNYMSTVDPKSIPNMIHDTVVVFSASGQKQDHPPLQGKLTILSKVIIGGHDENDIRSYHCPTNWGIDFLTPGGNIVSAKADYEKSETYYIYGEGSMVAAAWACGIIIHIILQCQALTKKNCKRERNQPASPFVIHEILRHTAKGNVRVEGSGFGPLKPAKVLLKEGTMKELLEALVWE